MSRTTCLTVFAGLLLASSASRPAAQETAPPAVPRRPQAVRVPGGRPATLVQFLRAADPDSGGDVSTALDLLGPYADNPGLAIADRTVAPALHFAARQLARLPAPRRYELLKSWTLPTADRPTVRLLAGFSSSDNAPEEFRAQAAWHRPVAGDEAVDPLPIPESKPARGPVGTGSRPSSHGFMSTAELLIAAARESRKLDDLATALQDAVGNNLDHARTVSLLVAIARGDIARVEPQLRQQLAEYLQRFEGQPNGARVPIVWDDYVLARACMHQPALRALGEEYLRHLMTHATRNYAAPWIGRLHNDLALGIADRFPDSAVEPGQDPGLALWHPAVHVTAGQRLPGGVEPFWLAHEDHVMHVAGPDTEILYFDYPLVGDFDFSVDAFDGGWGEANVGFAGLAFEALHLGAATQIWPMGRHEIVIRPEPLEIANEFNRVTVQVRAGRVRCLVNDHLVYEATDSGPTSPWLALFSQFSRQTYFRNAVLTGNPRIAAEVPLTNGDHLAGWIASFYGETQPPRLSVGQPVNPLNPGQIVTRSSEPNAWSWLAREGVIASRPFIDDAAAQSFQSRLYYHRPLRPGENIRYEFLYEPGRAVVHPALDRLAFLLEPDGVRLHWMTDLNGVVDPWSGLADNNVVDEPEHRRGPAKLPFQPGEWNALRLSLADDAVTLELNGVEVFHRPLESSNDRLFGFYHRAGESSVQVRNVVLAGNWPKQLSAEQMANLFVRATEKPTDATRRARHALVEERHLVSNWEHVQRRARSLPVAERYALLRAWVFPGPDHPAFRFLGGFTSTNPPPAGKTSGVSPVATPARRINTGSALAAPVLDLLAVAGESGKLGELANQAVTFQPANDFDRRSKLAFLTLVAIAQKKEAAAAGYLQNLRPLLDRPMPEPREYFRWPEFVVAAQLLSSPTLRPEAAELLETLVGQIQRQGIGWDWERRLRPLRDRARYLLSADAQDGEFGTDPPLKQWSRVTHGTSQTHAMGLPMPYWKVTGKEIHHYCGHDHDYLYFNSPLRGNFEINCQLTSFGWREAQVSYAGTWVGIRSNRNSYELSHYGRNEPDGVITPTFPPVGEWYDFRLTVADGRYTASINGQPIHEQILPASPDPWLAIHSQRHFSSGCRNLRITGVPIVPETLTLSELDDLTGWLTYYTHESVGPEQAAWSKAGEEIVGRKLADLAGSSRQSLLRYHRPLLEDGEITYEFYYDPGMAHVHPALDRLTLLLDPQGVRIHWLTDAQFDRTGLAHDNVADEPAGRRGPKALPLKNRDWNRVKLSLTGDVVALSLNGVEIFQRSLEPTNQRDFGLFHYADETEVRVRNVTYRGNWPRKFPVLAEQELAAGQEDR